MAKKTAAKPKKAARRPKPKTVKLGQVVNALAHIENELSYLRTVLASFDATATTSVPARGFTGTPVLSPITLLIRCPVDTGIDLGCPPKRRRGSRG